MATDLTKPQLALLRKAGSAADGLRPYWAEWQTTYRLVRKGLLRESSPGAGIYFITDAGRSAIGEQQASP